MVNRGEAKYLREFGVETHRIETMEDAEAFKRWLGQPRDVLGCDTENEGLEPEKSHIRYIQFGDLHDGWAVPWEDWRGLAIETLERYEGRWVFHNSKYDVREIQRWSNVRMDWSRLDDTMTMAHLCDPLRPKGLKPLAARLIDPEAVASQKLMHDAMVREKWDWDTIPMDFPWYWIYAALDPVLTCHIYNELAPQVIPAYERAYQIEMEATRVLSEMEAVGARVDLQYSQEQYDELTGFADKGRQWLKDEFGITGVSGPQLTRYFESQGIVLPDERTATGAQKMDKNVLGQIDHPVAKTILKIKKAEKLAEPYFRHFLDSADENSRVHCNVWSMGARTGRMSVTDPALQTLPKRDVRVRSAIIPSEGYGLISCDFDQIEARLMAHFSQSSEMQRAFMGDEDFFCHLASRIYGRPIGKHDNERKLTKSVVYGKLYGAGVAKMADSAGVPFDDMQHVSDGFNAEYPEVKVFQDRVEQIGEYRESTGGVPWIKTPTGRRLVADEGKTYALVNYLIQGHAAELFKRSLSRVDHMLTEKYGEGTVHLLLPIHDEIISEAPLEVVEEVMHDISKTMEVDDYEVPVTTDGEWSAKSWGDLVS